MSWDKLLYSVVLAWYDIFDTLKGIPMILENG